MPIQGDKPRYVTIDVIKALGILAVILIHTNAYFLSIQIAYQIWDIGQLFVPLFIFSSAFVYFRKNVQSEKNETLQYILKRTARLLPPYYLFLLCYFLFIFFSKPEILTFDFIVPHIIFTGGIDSNWLVLLFLYFSILFPVISFVQKKKKIFLILFTVFAFLTSVFFLFIPTPISYRITMIGPWLSIVLLALICAIDFPVFTKRLGIVSILSIIGSVFSYAFLTSFQKPLELYQNKYPPNLYFISLSVLCILFIYIVSPYIEKIPVLLKRIIQYISKNTYSLYFIHQLLIYFITVNLKSWPTHWIIFFVEITIVSIGIQLLLDRLIKLCFLSFFRVK